MLSLYMWSQSLLLIENFVSSPNWRNLLTAGQWVICGLGMIDIKPLLLMEGWIHTVPTFPVTTETVITLLKCCPDSKYKEQDMPIDSKLETWSCLPYDQRTLIVAASLLSSCTTLARASGLTPASSNCTHILSVSSSSPVFSKSEISFTAAKTKTNMSLLSEFSLVWLTFHRLPDFCQTLRRRQTTISSRRCVH